MENTERRSIIHFWVIAGITVLLPVIFFFAIGWFDLEGLPLYFAQLGLYAAFFLLAFWGLITSRIRLDVRGRSVLDALFITLLAWLVYALVLTLTGIVQWPAALDALRAVPAWKIGAQILSTWIFVGIGEEILFRGYFLNQLHLVFTSGSARKRTLLAVLFSSLLFSLWHLPVRIYELVNGESSVVLILLSVLVLFVLALGFAWLFIRTGNILLVGLVHGVMDFPLFGKESQLTFIILIAAIAIVEIFKKRQSREKTLPD